jgi:glutamate-1-semialdehyde 2,1-aminomutase
LRKETRSKKMFVRAQKLLVGGVNSPVRSFRAIGRGNPLFISSAKGSKIYDVDCNEYIDYVCSWGASILGSANLSVVKAVQKATRNGLSFGAATNQEAELAERIQKSVQSIELLRLVSSGTEATMSAVRVARAFTKRNKTIKFDGCYHGHSDGFLVKAGSGLATFSVVDSAGVPESVASNTLVATFNDLISVQNIFDRNKNEISSLIVEPVAGNMGVIPPAPGFLQGLRKLCDENRALLIFDEVITGFRISRGGAQELYHVRPDLTCLGKVIGGGMNMAAYGGRKDVMELVSPLGPVYQAGTLSGNPISVASGIATLDALTPLMYAKLERISAKLANELEHPGVKIQRVGSMLGLFFLKGGAESKTENFEQIKANCNKEKYAEFFNLMLDQGIYLPPSAFETIFVSTSHTLSDVRKTARATQDAYNRLM